MVKVAGGQRRRLEEGERLHDQDRISRLPDDVLGDIISLLPTREGVRTQVLSSRWEPLWRSSPLNLDLTGLPLWEPHRYFPPSEISRVLSSHQGSGRRLSVDMMYMMYFTALGNRSVATRTLEDWLRCPALNNLQELEFHYGYQLQYGATSPPPLPPSVRRFSSTLRVAKFGGCGGFPDGISNDASALLHLPVLEQLSLLDVTISETALDFLLAGCPVLQSLLLNDSISCYRVRIVSPTLRSVCVIGRPFSTCRQMILEDAPCLERLLLFPIPDLRLPRSPSMKMAITVISAPKLHTLGLFSRDNTPLKFGSTVFQGSRLVSSMTVVPSLKILALVNLHLSLDMVVNVMRCFPCLENLYIKTTMPGEKNLWCRKYRNLVSTLDIPLKKVVLVNYRGNKSHVNFAKFFVLNARLLESMVFYYVQYGDRGSEWIEKQHKLLQIKNKASRAAQFDFVYHATWSDHNGYKLAHDLSATDPFVRFDGWGNC